MNTNRNFLPLVCCFTFSVTVATTVTADNWVQYRGQAGDGKSGESIGNVDWSSGPKILWKAETPLGFSSFSVADGLAVTLVGENEREVCVAIDADTGKEVWSTPLGSTDYGHGGGNAGARDNKGGDGPRSTPTIVDGRVYVYDAHMVLSCLDAKTGNLVWKRDVVAENAGRNIKWANATSPLVDGETIYINGGGPGQSFMALDKKDGSVIWKSGDEMMTHATPHLTTFDDRKQVVFFTQSGLVSVDAATGQEVWRTKFDFSVSTAASPVSEGNLLYSSAGYGVGAGVFQVNGTKEPSEVWFKANELMNHWSTPIVHDGHLYGIYEFKKYGTAPLQCVDLKTGEIKWSQRGFGPGNCILVGDKLIALSDAGEVAIVSANPDGYHEIAKAKVIDGKCWSTPAFSNGRIYVRSTTEAACIEL